MHREVSCLELVAVEEAAAEGLMHIVSGQVVLAVVCMMVFVQLASLVGEVCRMLASVEAEYTMVFFAPKLVVACMMVAAPRQTLP